MFENIFISGNFELTGLDIELQAALEKMAGKYVAVVRKDQDMATWRGASRFFQEIDFVYNGNFPAQYLTREEYDQQGSSVVDTKWPRVMLDTKVAIDTKTPFLLDIGRFFQTLI